MSCHHGDRIGNSFSDNIAVGPFVELFAYCDSRRPPELGASLSIQPSLGFFATQRSMFLQAWALPGREEIPGSPQCIL